MDNPVIRVPARDQARARRVIALKIAYSRTGDRRKLKRQKRIMSQLRRAQIRRFEREMVSVSDALREHSEALRRFVDNITKVFAQIRLPTPKGPQL